MRNMLEWLRSTLSSLGEYTFLVLDVVSVTFKTPPRWYLLRDQLYEVGVASLPVVAITGFSTGMVLAAQAYFQLNDKGLAGATGLMVAKSMMVELGPILTAFMVTGRVGSAMCAELGTMKVTEQIDALKSMAINPNRYLLSPRITAGVFMLPFLTIFSALMGVFGGYLVAVYVYKMSPSTFFDPLPVHIHGFDFFTMLVKAFVFGVLIMTISCYQGLKTRGGAAGVGRSTTHSVVLCYGAILIINFLLTVALNNSYEYLTGLWNAVF